MLPTPKDIVEQLTQFAHRAVNSKEKDTIFQTLKNLIKDDQVEVRQEPFKTPYHYIQILQSQAHLPILFMMSNL